MLFVEERVRGSLVGDDFAAVSPEFGAHSFKLAANYYFVYIMMMSSPSDVESAVEASS